MGAETMVLAIMITKQCNFHCGHCMVDSSYEFSIVGDDIITRFIEMAEEAMPEDVYILGGEPFLHIDTVEKIINAVRKYCKKITVFTNGTFLLNEKLRERVELLDICVRISDDRFHRKSWTESLERKISESGYWVVERSADEDMIPVGRAYEEFKHLKYNMGCSLLTGRYDDEFYPNAHRYMVMMNGDVNLYCATIEGALANVFEDEHITYDLLVKREKILHNYLYKNVIKCEEDTYMALMCNRCSKYKVTEDNIYYEGKVVAMCDDYAE
jgi:organic radical activating enzyme